MSAAPTAGPELVWKDTDRTALPRWSQTADGRFLVRFIAARGRWALVDRSAAEGAGLLGWFDSWEAARAHVERAVGPGFVWDDPEGAGVVHAVSRDGRFAAAFIDGEGRWVLWKAARPGEWAVGVTRLGAFESLDAAKAAAGRLDRARPSDAE